MRLFSKTPIRNETPCSIVFFNRVFQRITTKLVFAAQLETFCPKQTTDALCLTEEIPIDAISRDAFS